MAELSRPRIVVRTQREAARRATGSQDNGTGFPPDILARAFEPYVTTKAKGTGSGTGHRQEDRGGAQRQHRDPQPPAGGRRSCAPPTRVAQQRSAATASGQRQCRMRAMSQILVVDDEVGIRELLSEILREEGHQVRLAENAGDARADPQPRTPGSGAARYLDARYRRHFAAQGMGHQRPAHHAGGDDVRPWDHRYRGGGDPDRGVWHSWRSRSRCRSC